MSGFGRTCFFLTNERIGYLKIATKCLQDIEASESNEYVNNIKNGIGILSPLANISEDLLLDQNLLLNLCLPELFLLALNSPASNDSPKKSIFEALTRFLNLDATEFCLISTRILHWLANWHTRPLRNILDDVLCGYFAKRLKENHSNDYQRFVTILKAFRDLQVRFPKLVSREISTTFLLNSAEFIHKSLETADIPPKFDIIGEIVSVFAGIEVYIINSFQIDKPLEIENRRSCSADEMSDSCKLKLTKQVLPEVIRSSFASEILRIISDSCEHAKLADSPRLTKFTNDSKSNTSMQFVLLNMRYFASAAFGKFLTSDIPVTNETADRTQATIATACTSWLSSVGAAVGLPVSGFRVSSSIANLCEVVLDRLLPPTLAFAMSSSSPNQSDNNADIVLSLFSPLIEFFSGSTNGKNSRLVQQIVGIMVDCAGTRGSPVSVHMHIERMALAISDLLVLWTLCEILCSVLQESNLGAFNGKSINIVDYLEEIVLKLTQSGKHFDAVIRQLADRITEVAVQHSRFNCLQFLPSHPLDKLLEDLRNGNFDSVDETQEAEIRLSLTKWSRFMEEVWQAFSGACPAGLARQMYSGITAESLIHIVNVVANTELPGDAQIQNILKFIWSVLQEVHKLLFRCVEVESEIFCRGLLSNDLQSIHASAMVLCQCLVVFGAPLDVLKRIHVNGFYSGLENKSFSEHFEPWNWLKVVDPVRFCQSLKEAPEHLAIIRHFGSNPYFAPISALLIIFSNNGEFLKPLLHAPTLKNAKVSSSNGDDIFSIYKACYVLFSTVDFNTDCYSTILGPLFASILDFHADNCDNFIWYEALLDFIGMKSDSIFDMLRDLALDRIIMAQIRERSTRFLTDNRKCSLVPDSELSCIRLVSETFSLVMEHIPTRLLAFFHTQDGLLANHSFDGGCVAFHMVIASLKRRIERSDLKEDLRIECHKVLSSVIEVLNDASREDIKLSREHFNSCTAAPPDLDSFMEEEKTIDDRRFQLSQQLRYIQHSDFDALLTMHEFLKNNVNLLQNTYLEACGNNYEKCPNLELIEPCLIGTSKPEFENDCCSMEDIQSEKICRCDLGITQVTLKHLLSLNAERSSIFRN